MGTKIVCALPWKNENVRKPKISARLSPFSANSCSYLPSSSPFRNATQPISNPNSAHPGCAVVPLWGHPQGSTASRGTEQALALCVKQPLWEEALWMPHPTSPLHKPSGDICGLPVRGCRVYVRYPAPRQHPSLVRRHCGALQKEVGATVLSLHLLLPGWEKRAFSRGQRQDRWCKDSQRLSWKAVCLSGWGLPASYSGPASQPDVSLNYLSLQTFSHKIEHY